MIRAIGFVPAAPLLVPQVAGGSADLDNDLRLACRDVTRRLAAAGGDAITVVAPLAAGTRWPDPADTAEPVDRTWGFEGFGVPRRPADPRPRLLWPFGIGDWLLDEVEWSGERSFVGLSPDATASPPAASGDALLVVGDGSARRTEKAPGHLDERAESFDASVEAALRDGDVAGLGGLDPDLAADLMCAGAPVWRWVAGVVGGRPVADAEVLAATAPYGVAYFAAWWRLADST
ncbi:MAG TPA: hypothetical protein VG650_03050 [Mycobacteriales bacterium]|nr:hypothetical protein [Mycobacteriales bacterium]